MIDQERLSLKIIALLLTAAMALASRPVFALDCNRNGIEDRVDIAENTSTDCNENNIPDECEFAPLQFGLREQALTVARFPRALTSGDFDGDGDNDLVTANKDADTSSTLSLLYNQGGGDFTRTDIAAGVRASSITSADLDGDGDLDLVTANFFTIELFWNDGSGVFSEPAGIEVDRATRFVTTGDLHGDGLLDLLYTNTSNDDIGFRLNAGAGSFTEAVSIPVGDYPTAAVIDDFNGDGSMDILVLNSRDDTASMLAGNGDGTFAEALTFPIGSRRPSQMATADLDGDGDLDLATSNMESVSIFHNDGSGAFSFADNFPARPTQILAEDIDGDGDPEIIFGTREAVVSVLNNVNGTFLTAPITFAVEFAPGLLTICDLDSDGDPELATAFERFTSVGILWNRDQGAVTLDPVRVNMGPAPHAAAIGDFDNDGFLDVATGDGNGRSITLFLNSNGIMRPRRTVPAGEYLNTIDSGDFDGDGDLDLVTGAMMSSHMQIFLNLGNAAFRRQGRLITGVRPFQVQAAELNGDEFPEVVSANEGSGTVTVWLNRADGTGTFSGRRDYRVGRQPACSDAVDLDGDGFNDLVVSNRGSRNISVLLNQGNGLFGASTEVPVDGAPYYVAGGDINRDGLMDVVVANPSGRSIIILPGRGDGTFDAGISYDAGAPPYSLIVHDINSDGLPDVVTGNAESHNISILLNLGDGTMGFGLTYETGQGPRFVAAGDLDNDSDVDLVAANHDSRDMHFFYNQAPTVLSVTHLEEICTELDYHELATSSARGLDLKFVMPVNPEDPDSLPLLYQNGHLFDLHQDFLTQTFPERFPLLGPDEYNRLVGLRASREYYIGSISRLSTDEGTVYGFSVYTDISSSAAELLTVEEARSIYGNFSQTFNLAPLAYLPDNVPARENAAGWEDPGFPIVFDTRNIAADYIPYTQAVGYGTVKILDRDSFEEANDNGRISFQDLLVLDHAPRDIEGVVSGVITAEPQGPLSHLSIRTARRNTPNAFLEGAISAFTPFEGQLVRLEVREDDYLLREATLEEAEAFWIESRPSLASPPERDEDFSELVSLAEMELGADSGLLISRFGGKTVNLARLQNTLAGPFERYGEVGFGIPLHHYMEFIRSNRLFSIIDPLRIVTYEEYINELFASEEFQSSSEYRFERLDTLREHMEERGQISSELVASIAEKIGTVFDSTTMKVRMCSSSNVEDALEFNGAGLYSSFSACAADDLDADDNGPSRCDPDRGSERGIARALRRVWASLWNFRAVEERAFYGVSHDLVGMGILVSRAFDQERANGVVFTGNPSNPLDPRYLVTSQVGENSVVSPDPGVSTAVDLLLVNQGDVLDITRSARSSLLAEGENVLSDDQLRELGAVLWHIDRNFPVETGDHERAEVVLDLEFKIEEDGSLAIKQVRPFLRNAPIPPRPQFELVVPAATTVCVGFGNASIQRDPRSVRELKSQVRFRAGPHILRTDSLVSALELIEEVRFGPGGEPLASAGPGLLRSSRITNNDGSVRHRFIFDQDFAIDDDLRLKLKLFLLEPFTARGEEVLEGSLTLDAAYLEEGLSLQGEITSLSDPDRRIFLDYNSCSYDSLDLWQVRATLDDGTRLSILERYRPPQNEEFGPIRLLSGEITLRGERRRTESYWELVYAASRHNTFVRHWLVLDPPVTVEGFAEPVAIVELVSPQANSAGAILQEPAGKYLSSTFEELGRTGVSSFSLELYTEPEGPVLQRGDTDSDGRISITDAITVLRFLFTDGEEPACLKTADADDDGGLSITDAVRILGYLFRGDDALPAPFGECGVDPSEDNLSCESSPRCQ